MYPIKTLKIKFHILIKRKKKLVKFVVFIVFYSCPRSFYKLTFSVKLRLSFRKRVWVNFQLTVQSTIFLSFEFVWRDRNRWISEVAMSGEYGGSWGFLISTLVKACSAKCLVVVENYTFPICQNWLFLLNLILLKWKKSSWYVNFQTLSNLSRRNLWFLPPW